MLSECVCVLVFVLSQHAKSLCVRQKEQEGERVQKTKTKGFELWLQHFGALLVKATMMVSHADSTNCPLPPRTSPSPQVSTQDAMMKVNKKRALTFAYDNYKRTP